MKGRFLFLLALGFIASHGGLSGVESAKATQVSQAQGCTIRVSNVRELVEAFDIASKNGQDDVICIQSGTYTINKTLRYDLTNRLSECGKSLTVRGEGNVIIQPAQGVRDILHIETLSCKEKDKGDITIQGIIFQNGSQGVEVSTEHANIRFINNTFRNNRNKGAKVETVFGSIDFENNAFISNETGAWVAHLYYGPINFRNNHFIGNVSASGAVYVKSEAGPITLVGNTFVNNKVMRGSATFYGSPKAIILANNVFYGNTYLEKGRGIETNGSGVYISTMRVAPPKNPEIPPPNPHKIGEGIINIVNNTFSMNLSSNVGGGIYIESKLYKINLYNNIFWNNISENDGHEIYVDNSPKDTVIIAHNLFTPSTHPIAPINFSRPQHPKIYVKSLDLYNKDIQAGCSRSGSFGNIQADPMFVNPEKGNFRLRAGSPAIDKGCNSAPSIPKTDKDGNQRIWNGIVDMGAYEHGPWPEPKEPDIEIQPQAQPQSQSEQQTQPQRQPQAQPQNTQQRLPSIPDSSRIEERAKEYIKEKSLEFIRDRLFRR